MERLKQGDLLYMLRKAVRMHLSFVSSRQQRWLSVNMGRGGETSASMSTRAQAQFNFICHTVYK